MTSREGLADGWTAAVAAARDGGIWVAEAGALIRLNEGAITASWGPGEGLPGNQLTSLLEDSRGRLWVGVDNGLAWREGNRFRQLRMQDGSALGVVRALTEDRDGGLWIITIDPAHALLRARDGRVDEVIPVERFGGQQIDAILADPAGGVWIALLNSGLKFYKDGRLDSYVDPANAGGECEVLFSTHEVCGRSPTRDSSASVADDSIPSTWLAGFPATTSRPPKPGDDGSLWLKTACGLVHIPSRRARLLVRESRDSGSRCGCSTRSTARKPGCPHSRPDPRGPRTVDCGLPSRPAAFR